MRNVHRHHRWQVEARLPGSRGQSGRGREDHHHRRYWNPRQSAPAAGGMDGARRRAMRYLYSRFHHVGQGPARQELQPDEGRGQEVVRRQPQCVPVHRIQAIGRRRDGRGIRGPRRKEERRPALRAGRERKHPRLQVPPPLGIGQGHRDMGLRRRRGDAHASRHAAPRPGAGRGLARQYQGHRYFGSGEHAGRREGRDLEGCEGQERDHRPDHFPDQ